MSRKKILKKSTEEIFKFGLFPFPPPQNPTVEKKRLCKTPFLVMNDIFRAILRTLLLYTYTFVMLYMPNTYFQQ